MNGWLGDSLASSTRSCELTSRYLLISRSTAGSMPKAENLVLARGRSSCETAMHRSRFIIQVALDEKHNSAPSTIE